MVLLLPFLIYLLQLSLSSPEGFEAARAMMTSWPLRLLGLLLLWIFVHHLLAGIRVLLIDMEWGSDLITARRTSWAVIIGTVLVVILIGAMLL